MEQTILKLERRVTDLIKLTEGLCRENELLKNDQRLLRQEFQSLREKNKIAHSRVEQIVSRLKSAIHP